MSDFFTSDLHLYHRRAIGYFPGRRSRYRLDIEHEERNGAEISTIEEMAMMAAGIAETFNDQMTEDDTLWLLGDLSFGKRAVTSAFLSSLRPAVRLLIGNHDGNRLKDLLDMRDVGLLASVDHYVETDIGDQRFVLMHYPIRIWNGSAHGSIHLHGHLHGDVYDCHAEHASRFKTMDVGIDTHPDMKAYSMQDVLCAMESREVLKRHGRNGRG